MSAVFWLHVGVAVVGVLGVVGGFVYSRKVNQVAADWFDTPDDPKFRDSE